MVVRNVKLHGVAHLVATARRRVRRNACPKVPSDFVKLFALRRPHDAKRRRLKRRVRRLRGAQLRLRARNPLHKVLPTSPPQLRQIRQQRKLVVRRPFNRAPARVRRVLAAPVPLKLNPLP